MLDVLRSITQEVNDARDLQTALDITVDRVQAAMGIEVCTLYLLDEKRDEFVFMATRGLNRSAVGKVTIPRGRGLVGLVGSREQPLNLHDAPHHPSYVYIEEIGEDPFFSFLGVPIIHHRKVLGVLIVQQQESRRFDESEEAFLSTLGTQLGAVIAHAKATGSIYQLQHRSDPNQPGSAFNGVSGAPGIAIGTAVVVYPPVDIAAVPDRRTDDVARELEDFREALSDTREEIQLLSRRMEDRLQRSELVLFDAFVHMLDDDAIGGEVESLIRKGSWARGALREVILRHVHNIETMQDSYLRERAADVKDLGNRVLARLMQHRGPEREFPDDIVLISDELTFSMLAEVPTTKLKGLVSLRGSGSSHVAIMGSAMNIPTVMGTVDLPLTVLDEAVVIVDGFRGVVIIHPSRQQRRHYERLLEEESELRLDVDGLSELPGITPDGHQVGLWVNTGLMQGLVTPLDAGAEGVGLYRTEVHFMMNDRFPTEEEQRVIYREHMQMFGARPVTMRTLDIGGDKTLPYFPISEENPFLGWRGIRITLDHPEIFLTQVRAMIHASQGLECELKIMLPMVSSLSEVDEALVLIDHCYQDICEEAGYVRMPEVGVMIEVPAAVYQAEEIISRVDFISVGSNDLTQYLLAVDRNNTQVAPLYEEFHPAVIRALKQIALAARAAGKPISICGEMAGDPAGAILLVAMGYDVLSMSIVNLPFIKLVVRTISLEQARDMLEEVSFMERAEDIKEYLDEQLKIAGLARVLRQHDLD